MEKLIRYFILWLLIMVLNPCVGFGQKYVWLHIENDSIVRRSTHEIIHLDKKKYLYIDCFTNDTVLVEKGRPASSEQMGEDLLALERLIANIDPTIPIKTTLTGFPILEKIKENNQHYMGKKLTLSELYTIVQASANLRMGQEKVLPTKLTHPQAWNNNKVYYNKEYHISYSSNTFRYIDGKYYLKNNNYEQLSSKTCKKLSDTLSVVELNRLPLIEQYKNNIQSCSKIFWDPEYRQFYSTDIRPIREKGKNNLVLQDVSGNKMMYETDLYYRSGTPFFNFSKSYYSSLDIEMPVVWRNDDEKLLYMRIPTDDFFFYYEETKNGHVSIESLERKAFADTIARRIASYKNEKMDKIVIDLRFQHYSSRTSIPKLLKMILDQPLYVTKERYIRNTPEAIDFVKNNYRTPIDGSKTKEVCGASYLLYSTEIDTINPDANSLNYKGNIYFFVDATTSSEDLLFLSRIIEHPRIKIWGVPNGQFLYTDIRSLTGIVLPNSGVTFSCYPFIVFPAQLDYFYTAGIDRRIFLDVHQYNTFQDHKGYIFNFDFLKTNDPYLRELLRVEN